MRQVVTEQRIGTRGDERLRRALVAACVALAAMASATCTERNEPAIGATTQALSEGEGWDPTPTAGATLWMDKSDYQPGEMAGITGTGFQPLEAVTLEVLHADGTPREGADHEPWTVDADADGKVATTWHVCTDDCVGSTLMISATGAESGVTGTATFSDASLTNGNFETGTLSGWATTQSNPQYKWSAYAGTCSPISARPVAAPPQGCWAATSDENGTSYKILYQDVTVPTVGPKVLSFILYYRSEAAFTANTQVIDFNQQRYRVDLVKTSAVITSLAVSDVLQTLFDTQPGAPQTKAPTLMTFDLTAFAGQTIRLRFASMTCCFYMRASVDDVRLGGDQSAPTTCAAPPAVCGTACTPACPTNTPPTCAIAATAPAECTGGAVAVNLNGSGTDAEGNPLTYAWSTNCPGGGFVSPTAPATTLSLSSAARTCSLGCTATLTVSDGQAQTTCSRPIAVNDTTRPSFTLAPSDQTFQCGAGTGAAISGWLASATATDTCTSATVTNNYTGLTNGCSASTGTAAVTFTAGDPCGNVRQTSATLSVVDTIAPTVTCPAVLTTECTGPATAVNLTATASDACSGALPGITQAGTYPVGVTPLPFSATDSCGNSGVCDSAVVITDTTAPTIACPADLTRECNANHAATGVAVADASAADLCGNASVSGGVAPGFVFPLGTTAVSQVATDQTGNHAICTSNVTVADSIAPTLTCPAAVTVECNADHVATGVSAGIATASDVCTATTVTDPADGAYPLGTTPTTHGAVDEAGNGTSCTNTVTVVDTIAPALSCPANVVVECNAPGVANGVSAGAATATEVCTSATITNPAIGSYPLGTTVANHGAVDEAGNAVSCGNQVIVRDTTKPVFDPGSLAPRTVLGTCANAPVSFTLPTASDVCQATTVTCPALPGNSVGANNVTCTATDLSGNQTTVVIVVNVLAPLRLAFQSPLEDDNAPDDPNTDTDVGNVFKVGSTVPHKIKIIACNGTDVTAAFASRVTLRLTETYRSGVGNGSTAIVPEYNGQGDAGGVLNYDGSQFHYNLSTNAARYPAGTTANAAYFSSLITATYNSSPGIVAGREDARLESK